MSSWSLVSIWAPTSLLLAGCRCSTVLLSTHKKQSENRRADVRGELTLGSAVLVICVPEVCCDPTGAEVTNQFLSCARCPRPSGLWIRPHPLLWCARSLATGLDCARCVCTSPPDSSPQPPWTSSSSRGPDGTRGENLSHKLWLAIRLPLGNLQRDVAHKSGCTQDIRRLRLFLKRCPTAVPLTLRRAKVFFLGVPSTTGAGISHNMP